MKGRTALRKTAFVLALLLLFTCTIVHAEEWVCPTCGKTNTTKFCTSCATKHDIWICPNCGTENDDAFCGNCGTKKPTHAEDLFGTWFFSTSPDQYVYLRLQEDLTCIIKSEHGITIGTMEITDDILTLTLNDILHDYSYRETTYPLTGRFSFSESNLKYEPFGIGTKSAEDLDTFTIVTIGESMNDTIDNGDILHFNSVPIKEINRFDIVAVNFPGRAETIFIKRIVAFPGETINMADGYLYINGIKQEETYVNDKYRIGILNSFEPYTIPENKYFVMGDHRNNSNDSRSIGPIPASMILGVLNPTPDTTVVSDHNIEAY